MRNVRPFKNKAEIAVIGGGLAGLTAAAHAARLGHFVTLFEASYMYGGQVATILDVDGMMLPGTFSGQDIAIHLLEEARKLGVETIETPVSALAANPRLTLTDETGKDYFPAAIIIASGASLRKLGVPGEEEFLGRGVSRCAACDGGFFRGQDVVVAGGGDSAVEEALVLAKTSRRVTMVCHGPLTAKRDYIEKLAARDNVVFAWDSEICDILGDNGVAAVRLRNVKTGDMSEIACSGVFPFIGVAPNSAFLPAAFLTETGHVKTGADLATADPRLFAAGAVRAGYGGNAVQAMAEGVGAAEAASSLLLGLRRAEAKPLPAGGLF
jgi:thioredoxin reductase (NADPH)